MKKTLFILMMLAFIGNAYAQQLIINNNSTCTDVNVVMYADNTTACGPITVDQSNTIFVARGTTYTADFSSGPYSYPPVPTGFWNGGSALSSTFNFFQAEVWSTCDNRPLVSSTCSFTGGNLSGVFVQNPNCSTPSTASFVTDNVCNNCLSCVWLNCIPGVGCTPAAVVYYVDFTISGSDWIIDIYQ